MASIERTLEKARIALFNATSEPEVLGALTPFGYGVERLQEGMALYEAARALAQGQQNARQSKVRSTQSLQQSLRAAKLHYHHDLRAARLALAEVEESRIYLQLKGKRVGNFDGWHAQAKDFYLGLRDKPELQELVATTGVNAERIEEGVRHLQEVEAARLQQRSQRGIAGNVRRQRNAAFQALMEWMAIFRKVARAALATTPAYLATLGMEPQPGKKKKKTDEKKAEAKPAATVATKNATTEAATSNAAEAPAPTATTQSEAAPVAVSTVLV